MGSGKSAIGKKLASYLNFDFIDLDDFIEASENMTISELFKAKGEIYFRKQEHIYLRNLLDSKSRFVLSLGGGTPCYGSNMEILKSANDVKSFYLKAGIKTLLNRLSQGKENRPLIKRIKNDDVLEEFIAKHIFERRPFYNQADIEISVDGKSLDEITREVLLNLYQ